MAGLVVGPGDTCCCGSRLTVTDLDSHVPNKTLTARGGGDADRPLANPPGGRMPVTRPFRFGGGASATDTATKFAEHARRLEGLGYDTLLMPDHFEREWFAAGPALTAA